MSETGRDIDELIVRQLDGELPEDKQLALNRELMRDPEARRLMEDYRRIDALSSEALERAMGKGEVEFDPVALTASRNRGRALRIHRGWWLVSGAVAAALLALIIPRSTMDWGEGAKQTVVHTTAPDAPPIVREDPLFDRRYAPMRTVGSGAPARLRRDTGREVIGVLGDDGNIYWIEIDRTRIYKRPLRQPGRQGTGGSI